MDAKGSEEPELGLSLEKLNLGPKKKLLIMNLNGFLLHRAHVRDKKAIPKSRTVDYKYRYFLRNTFLIYIFHHFYHIFHKIFECIFIIDYYFINCITVYKRPFSEEFMKFCLERFEVGLWSSAMESVTLIFFFFPFYFLNLID